jgi:hypothetical protein
MAKQSYYFIRIKKDPCGRRLLRERAGGEATGHSRKTLRSCMM